MPMELTLALNALTMSFNLLVLLAACGAPLAAFGAEAAGMAQKQVLVRKIGQHASGTARLCLIYLVLTGGLSAGLVVWRMPGMVRPWLNNPPAGLPPLVALAALLVLAMLHAGTWKAMKKARPAHLAIGLLAGVAGIASMLTLCAWARLAWTTPPAQVGQLTFFSHVDFPPSSPLVPLFAQAALLAPAAGGILSMFYVYSRRAKDDFGRDYYNRALRFLAAWSAVFVLFALAAHGWWAYLRQPLIQSLFQHTYYGYVWAGACGVGLVTFIGLIPVARAELPLRHKLTVFLTGLGLMVHMAGYAYIPLHTLLTAQ